MLWSLGTSWKHISVKLSVWISRQHTAVLGHFNRQLHAQTHTQKNMMPPTNVQDTFSQQANQGRRTKLTVWYMSVVLTQQQYHATATVNAQTIHEVTYEKERNAGSERTSGSLRIQSKTTFTAASVGQSRSLVSFLRVDCKRMSNSDTGTFNTDTNTNNSNSLMTCNNTQLRLWRQRQEEFILFEDKCVCAGNLWFLDKACHTQAFQWWGILIRYYVKCYLVIKKEYYSIPIYYKLLNLRLTEDKLNRKWKSKLPIGSDVPVKVNISLSNKAAVWEEVELSLWMSPFCRNEPSSVTEGRAKVRRFLEWNTA